MRFVCLVLLLSLASCKSGPEAREDDGYGPNDVGITDLKVGTGEMAARNMKVTVHYRGTLDDGRMFDSSLLREPLTFKLGARQVIRGWDYGILGMRVGGRRKLVIPPALAYGDTIHGSIPPSSTLTFEIELKAVSY